MVDIPDDHCPVPASKELPEWYKNTNSYINDLKVPVPGREPNTTTATIKKCMPIFDVISSGYIIKSPADVYVIQRKNDDGSIHPWFEWANFNLIEFHGNIQAELHPALNDLSVPKWVNAWGIKTPKGYSVLFTQPMHRDLPFTILPGIVDTDTYNLPVSFPFTLNDINFEGLIPAGTPIAQVIPFKREDWKMELGSEKDAQEMRKQDKRLRSKFYDSYKTQFRQNKEYK
jgi:hypothetical protein